MLTYSAIVCTDDELGIGYKNDLLFKSPIDLQHFKNITKDKMVIMGRKTADSIVEMNGSLLPNRTKLILTRNKDYKPNLEEEDDSIFIYHDLEHIFYFLNFISNWSNLSSEEEEVVIIGGEQIYRVFAKFIDKIYLTHVHHTFRKKDAFFPISLSEFELFESSQYKDEYYFSINTFIKRGGKSD